VCARNATYQHLALIGFMAGRSLRLAIRKFLFETGWTNLYSAVVQSVTSSVHGRNLSWGYLMDVTDARQRLAEAALLA
jgi:hypothetical protein